MLRRMIATMGILLFCILLISCKGSDGKDKMTKQDRKNSNEEETPAILSDDNEMERQAQEDMTAKVLELDSEKDQVKREGEGSMNSKDIPTKDTLSSSSVNLLEMIRGNKDNTKLRDKLNDYDAGLAVDTGGVSKKDVKLFFYATKLSDQTVERIKGKSYGKDCDIPLDELRYVRVLHIGFDNSTYIGELIVNEYIAEDMVDIFLELYTHGYPIERMVLVDEYAADDNASMAANNTSAFNYRNIDRSKTISKHSYGLAIDINPLYNPYVRELDGEPIILPENGEKYADRSIDNPYYIKEGDVCWNAFDQRGFDWGGSWKKSKDYQHFDKDKPGEN